MPVHRRAPADRRALRRLAGLLCLVLAAVCLVAAGVSGQPAPAAGGSGGVARVGGPPPAGAGVLLPATAVSFVVVLAAAARRRRWLPAGARSARRSTSETFRKSA